MNETMQLVSQMITTVGFPIAACIYLAWFTKYQNDSFNKTIETALNNLQNTVSDLKNTIEILTTILGKEGK